MVFPKVDDRIPLFGPSILKSSIHGWTSHGFYQSKFSTLFFCSFAAKSLIRDTRRSHVHSTNSERSVFFFPSYSLATRSARGHPTTSDQVTSPPKFVSSLFLSTIQDVDDNKTFKFRQLSSFPLHR